MSKARFPFETLQSVLIAVDDLRAAGEMVSRIGLRDHRRGQTVLGEETLSSLTVAAGGVQLCFVNAGSAAVGGNGPRIIASMFAVSDLARAVAVATRDVECDVVRGADDEGGSLRVLETRDWLGFDLGLTTQPPRAVRLSDNPVFARFQHVCSYVDDDTDLVPRLASMGLPLSGYPHRVQGDFTELVGMTRAAFWKLGYKHVLAGDVHIQVMTPDSEDTPQRRFVDRFRRRGYSVGFYADDLDAAEAELVGRGLSLIWKGRHENGWGFSYFGTFEALGFHLCVRSSPRT